MGAYDEGPNTAGLAREALAYRDERDAWKLKYEKEHKLRLQIAEIERRRCVELVLRAGRSESSPKIVGILNDIASAMARAWPVPMPADASDETENALAEQEGDAVVTSPVVGRIAAWLRDEALRQGIYQDTSKGQHSKTVHAAQCLAYQRAAESLETGAWDKGR